VVKNAVCPGFALGLASKQSSLFFTNVPPVGGVLAQPGWAFFASPWPSPSTSAYQVMQACPVAQVVPAHSHSPVEQVAGAAHWVLQHTDPTHSPLVQSPASLQLPPLGFLGTHAPLSSQ